MKKTLGIIGGMGPMATVDLYRKIIEKTDASRDAEHIHVLIDSDPAIPDRTAGILGRGPSPLEELTCCAKRLERAGADILMIPCNTAHFYYDAIKAATSLPILHMLRLTAAEIKRRGTGRVALLATDGTIETGIYAKLFESEGIAYMTPDAEGQATVVDLIYSGVKAGRRDFDTAAVRNTLDRLMSAGASAFVLGCTELPIAFDEYRLDYPAVDPTAVLARAAVEAAGYPLRAD